MRSTTLKKTPLSWEVSYFIDGRKVDTHIIKDSLIAHECSEAFLKGNCWVTVEGNSVYFDPQLVMKHHGDPGIFMGEEELV